jgi:hypothetical protein
MLMGQLSTYDNYQICICWQLSNLHMTRLYFHILKLEYFKTNTYPLLFKNANMSYVNGSTYDMFALTSTECICYYYVELTFIWRTLSVQCWMLISFTFQTKLIDKWSWKQNINFDYEPGALRIYYAIYTGIMHNIKRAREQWRFKQIRKKRPKFKQFQMLPVFRILNDNMII